MSYLICLSHKWEVFNTPLAHSKLFGKIHSTARDPGPEREILACKQTVSSVSSAGRKWQILPLAAIHLVFFSVWHKIVQLWIAVVVTTWLRDGRKLTIVQLRLLKTRYVHVKFQRNILSGRHKYYCLGVLVLNLYRRKINSLTLFTSKRFLKLCCTQ